ncbi:hypothetical protein M3221_12795 [Domibacillus indicus]|uniref:hypothetical protein n=1 Tax=Domibacillus indicus TaxID=1437523 RepID=UPI00203C7369|nr:hypothetical protein [Domibacillus indicus]MCM3789279.1 hypothetical protein [Domibacillus indicus]
MNEKIKQVLFWGTVSVSGLAGVNFFLNLFERSEGHERYGYAHQMGRGHGGGPAFHADMHGPHHGGDFSWLVMMLLLTVAGTAAIFAYRWYKKKDKADAFQQFVTNVPASKTSPPINQSNADILDSWEKEQKLEKENE